MLSARLGRGKRMEYQPHQNPEGRAGQLLYFPIMLRATSRLQALSSTFSPSRPQSTLSKMSANISIVTAKDACPRKSYLYLSTASRKLWPIANKIFLSSCWPLRTSIHLKALL